jgi:broad specificity phosphatase PhoE
LSIRAAAAAAAGAEAELAPRACLIRHAQASWGSADYDCLSPLGEAQARHLGRWLASDRADTYTTVVRGSMRRHVQTLEAIKAEFAAAGRILPAITVDAGWNEFEHEPVLSAYAARHDDNAHLAAARGGEVRAQRAVLMAAVEAWRAGDLDDDVPETWPAFGQRIAAARARIGIAAGTVLIVTSGGAMWRCAQAALGLDDTALAKADLAISNTGISEFRRDVERWHLLSWNSLPHLAESENRDLHTHY